MREFLFLYKGGDPDWAKNRTPEEIQVEMAKWGEWLGKLQANGNLGTGGDPLEYTGKTVASGGVVTDFSLAEVKELVGGYSIIKAETIEQAAEFAKGCPALHDESTVEIRPIMKM